MATKKPEPDDYIAPGGADDEGESLPSLLEVNFDEVPELGTVPAGEYEIRCERIRMGNSKKEPHDPYCMLSLSIPSEESGQDFTHVIMLPGAQQTEKDKIKRLNDIRTAAKAFDVDVSAGVDFNQFVNQTAWAVLKETDSPEYGEQNSVQQFVGGR